MDKQTFCTVYDCGTSTRGNSLSHSIQNSGLPEEIDILFISHFDKDHISGVTLKFHPNDIKIEHTVIIDTKERVAMWKDKDDKIIQLLNKETFLKYKDEIEKKLKK